MTISSANSCASNVSSPAVILVVEDTEELLDCVAEYFRLAGFEVVAATNASEALDVIDSGRNVDLVFTDINLPGAVDGLGLAHWLSIHRPLLPVVITSGQSRPELPGTGPQRRFVPKPYVLDALEGDIRELLKTVPRH